MPQPLVRYSTQHGIALIEFDNPPANTYSYEMMTELDQAILRARFDDEIYVLLLRGVGDKFFSAGADIEMLNRVSPQFKYNFCLHANETQPPGTDAQAGHCRAQRPRRGRRAGDCHGLRPASGPA